VEGGDDDADGDGDYDGDKAVKHEGRGGPLWHLKIQVPV
jgi:hypothetical protein